MFGILVLAGLMGCGSSPPETRPDAPIRAPGEAPTAITAKKTNVVVVMLDTVRADHLGLYGYELPTSPHLDAYAEKSVVFDQHIANCSWTRPSMGSIFTGLYPRQVGLYEERFDKLSDEFTVLSEHFKDAGYFTMGLTSNPNMNRVFGFVQGFDAYSESGLAFSWMPDDAKEGKDKFGKSQPLEDATTMTNRTLAMVDAHADTLATEPFYLQVVYIDPHWPYEQPKRHEDAVKGSKKAGYDGGIHFVDEELHRLMQGLEARGLLQDTLVVITGDHGEGLWSHPGVPNSAWHGNTLYESVLHIPFIVNHPVLEPRRVPDLTEGLDIVPTVLGLVGLPIPDGLPGHDLTERVYGRGEPIADRMVFSETDFRNNRKQSVRTATHKLIRNEDVERYAAGLTEEPELDGPDKRQLAGGAPVELYRMGPKTVEIPRNNQAERDAETLATLRAALEKWEADHPRRDPIGHDPEDKLHGPDGAIPEFGGVGDGAEIDEATRKALQELGYLEE
jgi:arylsulfatase A-like enzyme